MPNILSFTFVFFLSLISYVAALGATDTITWGGDNSRAGYQTNHNMDPTVVGSAQFGQIFKAALPGKLPDGTPEQIFAQPLVYTTPSDGIQYLYVATTLNNIYKMDARTGAIILKRNLGVPFSKIDIDGCGDISPVIGITGTGVIDPDTDTWYFTSKTYSDQTQTPGVAQGQSNGRNLFHSINVNDLTERTGFPVDMEGTVARNNPQRSFGGGIHHQRPALLHVGQYIYAGYGSHCVKFNYTGWVMGWDKTTGEIVERYSMAGAPVDSQTQVAGIWMSGGGLASDDKGSMFFATGNGHASQLSTIPVNGKNPPSALEEAAVHMSINPDGTLTAVDFFMPWEKPKLDGDDRDLGTSPLEILPTEFSCGEIKRIGVVTGKSGKTYFLDLNRLGGYQNGPNKLDDVIQVYQNENSVYAGAGVYPLEGGYIYINVIKYPTHVFKFSCTNGVPAFTKVADSPENCAYLGVGHGTTTSLNGRPGTGLVWVSDVDGYNLRIYNAIPNGGTMTLINKFNIAGITKFTRPVFGNGRAYLGTTQGFLYGFGAPVNSPLNCSSPYDFGTQNLSTTSAPLTVVCTAKIGVTVTSISLNGNPNFIVSGTPVLPLQLTIGKNFTYQAQSRPSSVGILSSDVIVSTTNGVTGYSITTPVSLQAKGQSIAPLLEVSPITVSFEGSITGGQVGGINQTVLFYNNGNSDLTISDMQYSVESATGAYVRPNTTSDGFPQVGPFTFYDLPTIIPGKSSATVIINFDTTTSGNFATYITVNSDGGSKIFDVIGTSGDPPSALVEFQTQDGSGWIPYVPGVNFTFGNVTENQNRFLKLRVTNIGHENAAKLSVTVSKPPFGLGGIISANNQVDLGEGTILAAGENATATMYCSVPKTQWDTDSYPGTAKWVMNLNDNTFGHQEIIFDCTAVSEQAPPLLPNGNGQYRYIGCYKENNPGRQLAKQIYGNDSNTIPMCISACAAGNYIFCGTQYNRECWGGPTIPKLRVDDGNCNFPCKGAINQNCGGNGINGGGPYISLFADSLQFDGNVTAPTTPPTDPTPPVDPSGPYVNPGVGGYTSIGCYTESTTGRALPNGKDMVTDTVASCISLCSVSSYRYAGLEYGQECWCGNAFSAGSVPTAITECKSPCKGNGTEFCGAGSRLNVYEFNVTVSSSTSSSSTSTASSSTSSSSSSSVQVTSSTSTSLSSSSSQSSSVSSTTQSSSSVTDSSSTSASSPTSSIESTSSLSSTSDISTSTSVSSSSDLSSSTQSTSDSSTSDSSTSTTTQSSSSTDSTSLSTETSSVTSSSSLSSSSVSSTSQTSSSSSSSSTSSSLIVTSSTSLSSSTTSSSSSATPTQTSPARKQRIDPSWVLQGCWTESTTGRALSGATYAKDDMTLESCAAFCRGFSMFGVEYGRECYCGNTLKEGSVQAASQSECKFLCPGDPLEYCGAGVRLELYSSMSVIPSSTSTSSSVVSSSTAPPTVTTSSLSSSSSSTVQSSSSTTPTSSQSTSSSSSSSQVSTSQSSPTQSSSSQSSSTVTSTSHSSSTSSSSTQSTSTPSSTTQSSSSQSTSSTSSQPTTSSLSSSTLTTSTTKSSTSSTSTKSSTSSTSSKPATYTGPPVVSNGNVNFTYYSCISEPNKGRLLPSQVSNSASIMTIEKCLSDCWMYKYAGVEYGRECWCGNVLSVAGTGLTPGANVSNSECALKCPGNSSEFCGERARMSLYYYDFAKAARNSAK